MMFATVYSLFATEYLADQYHELLRLFGQFNQHKISMAESICVSSIIEKLPPSWKDFKIVLKHKKRRVVQLGSHLRIEEGCRMQESGKKIVGDTTKINMIEVGESSKNNKGKRKFTSNKNKTMAPTKGRKVHVGSAVSPVTSRLIVALRRRKTMFKGKGLRTKVLQLIKDDDVAWWIDSSATKHVCKDRNWFKVYEPVETDHLYTWEMSLKPRLLEEELLF